MNIRVGTRGSRLALTQTNLVITELKKLDPELVFEIVIIKTKGDKILDVSLDKIGDKGLFVKEIEEQLLKNQIDMAVHSMKDMPGASTPGLKLMPILKREDPRDVLITKHPVKCLKDLPKQLTIATGSKRRASQLKLLWPDVIIEPIRGNVETRINKMIERDIDGTVLAYAGVNRIDLKSNDLYTIIPFEVDEMIPAPAQGVLGLQFREQDSQMNDLVKILIDEKTELETNMERLFLKTLHGSCHLPMGAYLDLASNLFYGIYGDEACTHVVKRCIPISIKKLRNQVVTLAESLVKEVTK